MFGAGGPGGPGPGGNPEGGKPSVDFYMNDTVNAFSGVADAGTHKPTFTDVAEDSYYADAVAWAVDRDITTGTSWTTFDPSGDCTRAQVVTFLWRAAGEPEPTTTENPFVDVKETAYYYNAVLWAVENEITKGTSSTAFSPNATATRGEIVTFLYRYAKEPERTNTVCAFTDVTESAYYYDAVLWAVENEITKGTSETAFSPKNVCNRGQIVTFLYRFMGE